MQPQNTKIVMYQTEDFGVHLNEKYKTYFASELEIL